MSHRLHRLNLPYDKDDVYVTRFTVMLQYTHDIDKTSILSVTINKYSDNRPRTAVLTKIYELFD